MKLKFGVYIDGVQYYNETETPFVIGQKVWLNKEFRAAHNPGTRVDIVDKIYPNPRPAYFPVNILVELKRTGHTIDLSYLLRKQKRKRL